MDASARGVGDPARPRDGAVDTLLFLAAAGSWLLVVGGRLESSTSLQPGWLFAVPSKPDGAVVTDTRGGRWPWVRRSEGAAPG